jgi:hypothetical protein
MRSRLTIAFALALFAALAASPIMPQSSSSPCEVTLRLSQSASIGKLKITFVSVDEDSRCPEKAQCMVAGRALITLSESSANEKPSDVQLSTNPRAHGAQQPNDSRFQLKSLEPHPIEGQELDPKSYVAVIRVFKAENGADK